MLVLENDFSVDISGCIAPDDRPPDKSAYWKTIFFSHPKHMVLVLNPPLREPKHMFKLSGKKILTILGS